MRLRAARAAVALGLGSAALAPGVAHPSDSLLGARFSLSSPAFPAGGRIPVRYTCDGASAIVPLRWTAPPARTRSFALLVEDPDAPSGTFTHRVSWGIPGTARSLRSAAPREGTTSAGRVGWVGPCPPSGTHRYIFRLYALRAPLRLGRGADRAGFVTALRGKVLATASLIGRYGR